jgi:hypothetical protein
LLLLVGCSSSTPVITLDASPSFEYSATVSWSTQETPDVTAVTIDGHALSSGEQYVIDETYPSYDAAVAAFVPHPVVVTTSTGTLNLQLDMQRQACSGWGIDAPVTNQTESFYVSVRLDGQLGVEAFSGSCTSSDGRTTQWAARTK